MLGFAMRYITRNNTTAPTLRGIADHSWHARALCHGMPPKDADELFFPSPRDHAAIREARSHCRRCPVQEECLGYALDNEIRDGIWGGLTEPERRPLHTAAAERLDYGRLHAVLHGRDIHLSPPERKLLIHHAVARGWTPERVAHLLSSDRDWIRDQMCLAGHDIDSRDLYQDGNDDSTALLDPLHTHGRTSAAGLQLVA
jgi:WhiB family redox-sensing transcriptional regulator